MIGGEGALGRAIVEDLRSAGWTVHPAGRRASGRDARHIDLDRPETLTPALGDVDLTISTVPDRGFAAERWVLENGGVLVNCSHAAGTAAPALEDEAGPDLKGSVLLNAGLVPGLANLVAARLLAEHWDANCLEVAFTVLKEGTAGRGGGEFVHRGLISRPRHRVIRLPFPEFGDLPCLEIYEDDDCGFGGVSGSRRIENYLAFADCSANLGLRTMNSLNLMRLLPAAALAAGGGRPHGLSQEPTMVWVGARRDEERLGASVIECAGDYRTTAQAGRSFAEALLEGRPRGCFNPEDLFEVGDFMWPLKEMGVRIAAASC